MSEASTDQTLGRMSFLASLAALAGLVSLAFLPVSETVRHTMSATPSASSSKVVTKANERSVASAVSRMLPSVPTADGDAPTGEAETSISAETAQDVWSDAEIAAGMRECVKLLEPLKADFTFEKPIKKGQCGSPAPVLVRGLGKKTRITLRPAAMMNCRLAASLHAWLDKTVQPAARKHLGSPIVGIVGASSYACRNVYNLPDRPLSEHATGNAIDITGFVTKSGRTIMVVHDWGPTKRDIAEARRKKREEAKKAAAAKTNDKKVAEKADPATPSIAKAAGKSGKSAKGLVHKARLTTGDTSDNRAMSVTAEVTASKRKEAAFLKQLHKGACRQFATVLGPEANDVHRNHFHLDLKTRRSGGYCR